MRNAERDRDDPQQEPEPRGGTEIVGRGRAPTARRPAARPGRHVEAGAAPRALRRSWRGASGGTDAAANACVACGSRSPRRHRRATRPATGARRSGAAAPTAAAHRRPPARCRHLQRAAAAAARERRAAPDAVERMLGPALGTQQYGRHSGLPFCGVRGAAHAHERVERALGRPAVDRRAPPTSTPAARSAAMPATTSAAAALSTARSRCGPFSPASTARSDRRRSSVASPPTRSRRLARGDAEVERIERVRRAARRRRARARCSSWSW